MKRIKKGWLVFALVFILLLLFTRVYNLENTARFIWDESSDLVNIHRIYVEKDITLIGPISEDGNKVFGSLTHYMYLPFAVIGNFDPVSPAYGAVFWGVLTAIGFVLLIYRLNKKYLPLAILLTIIWIPFLETSRWAWNPNLIPFWSVVALHLWISKKPYYKILAGFALGLAIHHHYIAIFSVLALGIATFFYAKASKKERIKQTIYFFLGAFIAILPFILFDLVHKPPLFVTRILYFNYIDASKTLLEKTTNGINLLSLYYLRNIFFVIIFAVPFFYLIYFDIKKRNKGLIFLAVWLVQLVLTFSIQDFWVHYMHPGLIFFVLWLFYPRKKIGKKVSIYLIIILIISSLLFLPSFLKNKTWQTDIPSVRKITTVMEDQITENGLENINITVLASPDSNLNGRRYRDMLLLQDISLLTKYEYQFTDNLFIVSTSNEDDLRKDLSFEIMRINYGLDRLVDYDEIPNSDWKVYRFRKD